MTDHRPIFEAMAAWGDGPMAIATVVATWGSAPRPVGSHMLIHRDGRFEGSVSGGCVEGDVLDSAGAVIATGKSQLKRYGVADGAAWEVGLPCGGDIQVLIQRVDEQGFPRSLGAEILAAYGKSDEFLTATDMASGHSWRTVAGRTFAPPVFLTRYAPAHRLLIVGAVQIGQALASYTRVLGIATTVIDPRERFLTTERFPGLTLDDRWPDEAIAALRPDAATAVVTLSHDIKIDDPALLAALAAPTGYIAALGSNRSHAARCDRLRQAGISAREIERVQGPAGLPIGAIGAAEIALSIAAGMVRCFRLADDVAMPVALRA